MWYIKYFWVKLNIFILTRLVWLENFYKEYQKIKIQLLMKS